VTPAESLKRARAAGLRLELDGEDLVLSASAAPSESIVTALVQNKREVLALLRPGGCGWSAEDWLAFFEERAAMREHGGGLTRLEAARLALDDAVTQWLCLYPVPPGEPAQGCVHCRRYHDSTNRLLPVLTQGGHVWVHDRCHQTWLNHRRHEAREALMRLGVLEEINS
jgi:hypothetical protein